ncbi:MAG TPA: 1-deoxy-D-xylulose-5-phosphate reductoisomerase, partial [Gammaproteobacteria bacterium]|nr:1-deoxy-D-xylulose-5-phosphate reductoisomerase [Gammaproteobacteria bacterium]
MKSLCVLGATGSVGLNTLQVVQSQPHQFRVVAITAHSNVSGMLDLCRLHKPDFAVMSAGDAALKLEQAVQAEALPTKILSGEQGLIEVASLPQVDAVMAAIVGAAGLLPTLAAAKAGKQVLLANKEALVMAGALFTQAVEEHAATLLPIDSEHNAIFQCLPKGQVRSLTQSGIKRILLTASGGPFRETPLSQLATVTPQQACNHPNWDMGEKISVDSATMMNKG